MIWRVTKSVTFGITLVWDCADFLLGDDKKCMVSAVAADQC